MRDLTSLRWLAKPSPLEHAKRDLQDAQHDLLQAAACAEHYEATELMLRGRIERLREAISTLEKQES
jgi:hypothetical protein